MASILIIDPEDPVRALTRRILVMDHHRVVDVATIEEATALLQPGRFDLIITEIDFRTADGVAFVETIAARAPETPVIVATARNDADATMRCAAAGVIDTVTKPFGFGQISSAVNRVLTSDPETLAELRVVRIEQAETYRTVLDLETQARGKRRRAKTKT